MNSLAVLALTYEAKEIVKREAAHRESKITLYESIDLMKRQDEKKVFIFSEAKTLPYLSAGIKALNPSHALKVLFVHENSKYLNWLPQTLLRADLRTIRNLIVHSDFSIPSRILHAWSIGAEKELIADARVFDDSLIVQNCALTEYEVPFKDIPIFDNVPKEHRDHFQISRTGSYIYWKDSDIHLDFETIRYYADPEWRKQIDHQTLIINKKFGSAVARLRQEKGLKQKDIKGLSERQVRRIEREGETPTVNTLYLLAKAHGMNYKTYIDQLAEYSAKI